MKGIFKRALMIITLMLVMSAMSKVNVKADTTWGSYFGDTDEDWYEAAGGELIVRSDSEWSAEMDYIGWGGIWGAQVYQDVARGVGNVNVVKGGKYFLSFDMTSSGCNKWVYIKVTTGENVAYNDWIYLERGKTYHYNEYFVANGNADSIYFGMGGEFGDRTGVVTDGDVDVRYALHRELFGTYVTWDVDPLYATTITCSNFSLIRGKGSESGTWGDGATFKYNGNELTISGAGTIGESFCDTSAEKLTISEGIVGIKENTFKGFSSLKEITIPSTVITIGSNAFSGCDSLKKITVLSKDCAFVGSGIAKGAVIYGYKDSTAETYAKLYGHQFVELGTSNSNNPSGGITTNKPAGNTGTNKPAEATSSTKNMLKKVTSLKVKNLKKKKVKITWKKIKGAKGYEIVYAKNKKFTKDVNTKKVKKASKTSLTIKGLQKKKTYYFKVRAYNTVNGKTVYGEWSKVKKIKIKK